MTKSTFEVRKNPATGERYVCQVVDELNKNHTENCKESYSGYMPERRGEKNCPVESFLLYLQHLHPKCDSLWARPKSDPGSDDIWYYNRAVGVDLLGKFMKELSVKYNLSRIYTNHSIRVTGASILTRSKFSASQIKEVTGHKSVSSLAIYQRVSDEEKMQMGKSLGNKSLGLENSSASTRPKPTSPAPRAQPTMTTMPLSSQEMSDIEALLTSAPLEVVFSQPQPSQLENLPLSHQAESPTRSDLGLLQPIDFNLSPYLRDLEMDPECEFQSTQVMYQSSVSGRGRQSRHLMQHTRHVSPRQSHPIFAGCTIHNVTVNVHPQS